MQFERPERKQIRLRGYDYSQDGYYFVTICTKDREEFFGEIRNGIMGLNNIGLITCQEWLKTEQIRDNVQMNEWVVMPNHVHGIVIINNPFVGTLQASLQHTCNKFGPQRNNLASIIRGFKSSVKRICNKNGLDHFQWQSRYYDHIIRNEKSLNKISQYIRDNPIKLSEDVENRNNQFSDKQIKQHYNNLF